MDSEGPPHRRRFTTVALVGGVVLGTGSGPSKKISEQAAAREALARLDEEAL
jgi:ribonuclease-3